MEIDHHDCQDRAKLDNHIKHIQKGLILFELQQLLQQDQMSCTADGKPLGDSLHDSENNYF